MTRYRILREIGRGGLATVYEARRELVFGQEQAVALKVPHAERLGDPECRRLFSSEAMTTLRLCHEHPNLVTTYDAIVLDDGRPALVMELIDGVSLATLAATRAIPFDVVRSVARDVLSALGFLHRHGLVHRDVSAANILVGRDGVARLADLGLVKSVNAPASRVFRGTVPLAHPDQLRALVQTPAWDLWSLAATLFEVITGATPYGDGEPEEVCARIVSGAVVASLPDFTPGDLCGLIDGLLRQEPVFASAAEAMAALDRSDGPVVLSSLAVVMPRVEEIAAARTRAARRMWHRRGAVVALVLAPLLFLGGAGVWWLGSRTHEPATAVPPAVERPEIESSSAAASSSAASSSAELEAQPAAMPASALAPDRPRPRRSKTKPRGEALDWPLY